MKISIPENIGDEVVLDNGSLGKIISVHFNGPSESGIGISYEIGYWNEGEYRMNTFWRFEFKIASNNEKKVGF